MASAMSLSSFALVLSVFFYVFGFPLVFCDENYAVWRKKILKDGNMVRIIGMAFTMIAAVTLRQQWKVTYDGEGLVVLFAWVTLLKSIFMAWWPKYYEGFRSYVEDEYLAIPAVSVIAGFLMVLLGAIFLYFGILLPQ